MPAPVAALLVALAAAFACRDLFGTWLVPPSAWRLEDWLFEPTASLTPLAVVIGAWLCWRRRGDLMAAPGSGRPLASCSLLALAAGAFVWGHLVRAEGLLLITLAASLWAYGIGVTGSRGLRATALPGLVCLLALPLPAPIGNSLVWHLQGWTARAAASLLTLAGHEASRAGVELRSGGYAFLVVEQCSGIQACRILLLIAIAVRELFRTSGPWLWWIPLAAPAVGFAANAVRVSLIAMSASPAAELADHTPQGLAVLLAGTGLLYAAGWALAAPYAGDRAAPTRATPGSERPARLGLAAAWWGALAVISLALPAFRAPALPAALAFPERGAGWVGEDLAPEPRFQGVLPPHHSVSRRYRRQTRRRGAEVVDLFATYDVPGNLASGRYFGGKAEVPDGDWTLEERRPVRLWRLGVDATLCVASRAAGRERALIYVARFRDRGILRESWRDWLSLERSPLARQRPRAVLRLATPLGVGSDARDRARQTLDRFVDDFATALASL